MSDDERIAHDLRMFGRAYRYKAPNGEYIWLDPAALTIYHNDDKQKQDDAIRQQILKEGGRWRYDRINGWQKVKPSFLRRFIQWMTTPWRLVIAGITGVVITPLTYGANPNNTDFVICLSSSLLGWLIIFAVYEIQHWARGR